MFLTSLGCRDYYTGVRYRPKEPIMRLVVLNLDWERGSATAVFTADGRVAHGYEYRRLNEPVAPGSLVHIVYTSHWQLGPQEEFPAVPDELVISHPRVDGQPGNSDYRYVRA